MADLLESEDASRSDRFQQGRRGLSDAFRAWGFHDALRIIYVNSFVRVGEQH